MASEYVETYLADSDKPSSANLSNSGDFNDSGVNSRGSLD
jgi:hypothetical protein